MSSLTSHLKIRFLLDENVDARLEKFLKQNNIDFLSKEKRLSDRELAKFSKLERRIFVTNDEDFTEFDKENIFSVVWLKIPQRNKDILLSSFSKLLKEKTKTEEFEGRVFILYEDRFKVLSLPLSMKG